MMEKRKTQGSDTALSFIYRLEGKMRPELYLGSDGLDRRQRAAYAGRV